MPDLKKKKKKSRKCGKEKEDPKADTGETNYGFTKGKPFIMTD